MSSRSEGLASGPEAVALGPGEGRQIPPGDAPFVTIKAERRQSAGAKTAYEATVGPRMAGPPPHIHRTWDEAFYIIAGEMTFLIGDTTYTNELARQLTIFTPSGIEDFFDEAEPLLASGVAETAADFAALTERYDMPASPTERAPYSPLD